MVSEKAYWKVGGEARLEIGERSLLMGILNVTPDSFSDGGEHLQLFAAVARAESMFQEGAAIVDIGGESTRPGFEPVSFEEEVARVVPVIRELRSRRSDCILSIDTSKAVVAEAALEAGANIVNDVNGFLSDPQLAEVAAKYRAGVVLMRNGRSGEKEGSVLDRIRESWERSLEIAFAAGVKEPAIVLDPGVGFGTTRQEDLEILRGLDLLRSFGFPLLLGTSRKRITAEPLGLPVDLRLEATIATTVAGVAAGVELFRVHDVAENARAVCMADLIYRGNDLDE
ncbi:dihydropteroate synthase [Pelagicoccus sp. SDUM812005]|uniref:dihydropteroate synthase n=1 Tax=Pelagicoccus sp. SDUM812005 TaxID=3041257 RepID=UPI00280CCFA0|nr:dihydropteroate synthase [Pelagicoccus sp. SDUM812005]MDQ8180967.1 dihydropteroate synthase [Pelagicoccus sp. SDUM812005]